MDGHVYIRKYRYYHVHYPYLLLYGNINIILGSIGQRSETSLPQT